MAAVVLVKAIVEHEFTISAAVVHKNYVPNELASNHYVLLMSHNPTFLKKYLK